MGELEAEGGCRIAPRYAAACVLLSCAVAAAGKRLQP